MNYFHLAGPQLAVGSVIEPGNWGRIIRRASWAHNLAIREMALEHARALRFPSRPSRLDAAFVLPTREEAERFQSKEQGFNMHVLYRVTLRKPDSDIFITDWRLCTPCGAFRNDWPDAYWSGVDEAGRGSVPGIDWPTGEEGAPHREVLTLSQLQIEERFN